MLTLLLIGIGAGIALLTVPAMGSWRLRYKKVRLLEGARRDYLHELWRGDFDLARAALTDSKPQAMFVRACVELEAGELETARELAGQIGSDDPAVMVLQNLISRRGNAPEEPWLDSLEHSWLAAYRPSMVGNRFANSDLLSSYLDSRDGANLEGTDRVLWTALAVRHHVTGAVYPRAVRAWAMDRDAAKRELAELVITSSIIAIDTFDDQTPLRAIEIRDRIAELAPDNFWVRLAHGIAHEDYAGLTDKDLDALEHAIEAPVVDLSLGGCAFERFEQLARRANLPYPEIAPSYASNLCILLVPLGGLWRRFGGTVGHSRRHRAAEILVGLSRRMREDRYIYAATAANEAQFCANALLQSPRLEGELAARSIEHGQLTSLADHLVLNPWAWPVPSIVREAAVAERANELECYRRFLGDPNAALPQAWLVQR